MFVLLVGVRLAMHQGLPSTLPELADVLKACGGG